VTIYEFILVGNKKRDERTSVWEFEIKNSFLQSLKNNLQW